MSQRLYVGELPEEERDWYDCVVLDADVTVERLRREWLRYEGGIALGPYKIQIGDPDLLHQISPVLEATFEGFKRNYPENIWVFYYGDRQIEHPTKEELEAWLRS